MSNIELVLMILAMGLSGTLIFTFDPWLHIVDKYLNFKPFNCILCVTFWVSAITYFCLDINVIYAAISAYIAEFGIRILVNYE